MAGGESARDLARQGLGGLRVYSGLDGVDVTDRQLAAGDSDDIGAGGPHNETLPPAASVARDGVVVRVGFKRWNMARK